MPATEQLTITVPTEVADIIREAVSSGQYPSESAFVEERLWEFLTPDLPEEVLAREVLPAYDAALADPSRNIPLGEARARMAERHRNYTRAAA